MKSGFRFQPIPVIDAKMIVGELNKSASILGELRCGEYAFKLAMNPWQHPVYDKNIHHLFALLTCLGRGCGGVIYFIYNDVQSVTQEEFELYVERLRALIDKNLGTLLLTISMVQVAILIGTHRSWAVLLLKKSHDPLKYPPVETKGIWKATNFKLDILGQIYTTQVSATQNQGVRGMQELPDSTKRATIAELPPEDQEDTLPRKEAANSAVNEISHGSGSYENSNPEVDFSSCQRLNWSENKKDWQTYANIKEVKTDDSVSSCPILTPAQPMKITPDRDSLRYLFASDKDMEEAFSAVKTNDPGCAIVCRTWLFHIQLPDVYDTDTLPTGHICDILTVTDGGRLSFWVVENSFDGDGQLEYLMNTGRMLKFEIAQKGEDDDLSNLCIDCRLFSLTTSANLGNTMRLKLRECQDIQMHLQHMCQEGVKFELLRKALYKVILTKDSPMKRCAGDYASVTLSEQQAEVLMHKVKVNYIMGPAGSGKSLTAACLYKLYGKENSVYICTTKAFLEHLKYNRCRGTLVLNDQDLLMEIKSGTFKDKICVIIDDCHNFMCTRLSMKKLFEILKRQADMSLFVFADNDYQSFDRKRQRAIHDCILCLTLEMFNQVPLNLPLTDIYRNTRKVVAFVQAAIQDIHDGYPRIQCANTENGRGVECIKMSNIWDETPENDLVVYLRSLHLFENYSPTELAVLLDFSYTPEEIQLCKQIIAEHIPSISVQSAAIFPRIGVTVDSVDNFLGLDATVCVFILSNTPKKCETSHSVRTSFQRGMADCGKGIHNPRY